MKRISNPFREPDVYDDPPTFEERIEEDIRNTNLEVVHLAKAVDGLAAAVLELIAMLPNWTREVSRETAETVIAVQLGAFRARDNDQ
jgi:hypothetical protein